MKEKKEWTPLKVEDLRVGDKLEWFSSSSMNGRRRESVMESHHGWINIGPMFTPRNQAWLNNDVIKVERINSPAS